MTWRLAGMLGGGLLMLSALVGAFFFGRSTGVDRMKAEYAGQLLAAEAAQVKSEARVADAERRSAELEGRRLNTVREVYREIPSIVQGDPVYRNECISDDGVRALDRAAAAANGGDSGASAQPAGGAAGDSANGGPGDGPGEHPR